MKTVNLEPYWPNLALFLAQAADEAVASAARARGRKKASEADRAKALVTSRDETVRYLAAVWREKFPEVANRPDVLALLDRFAKEA